jgi:peroxiredoxin
MKAMVVSGALAAFALAQDASTVKVGEICPPLALKTVDGDKEIKLEDFRKKEGSDGQIVVVTFWSFKCPSGEAALPDLQKTYDYAKEKNVAFLGICSYGETAEALAKYAKEHNIPYPLLYDGKTAAAKLFAAKVVTASYILDREGRCLYKGAYKGRRDSAALFEALKEAVEGKEVTVKETQARG